MNIILRIEDYTNFQARRSHNGGQYGFVEVVEILESGSTIQGHHETTAEFNYCENCGRFEPRPEEHQEWCTTYVPSRCVQSILPLISEQKKSIWDAQRFLNEAYPGVLLQVEEPAEWQDQNADLRDCAAAFETEYTKWLRATA